MDWPAMAWHGVVRQALAWHGEELKGGMDMFLEQFRVGKKKVETYAELKKLAKDPSHPCGKPYTVEVTIEGIAPLLMVRWDGSGDG